MAPPSWQSIVLIGSSSFRRLSDSTDFYVCSSSCRAIDVWVMGGEDFNLKLLNSKIRSCPFVIEPSLCVRQACAPRYYWRTEHDLPFSDITGTCYLSVDGLKTFVEYAPCRTGEQLPVVFRWRMCRDVHQLADNFVCFSDLCFLKIAPDEGRLECSMV